MSARLLIRVSIFLLLIGSSRQAGCASENICGSHGYCYDDANGESQCECKFWWEGTVCNQQSASGKQVIILGSLVGTLLLLIIALNIVRAIRQREKRAKVVEEKKLVTVAIEHAKSSMPPWSSWLLSILTLLVAAITLLIKWSLIKSIHNHVADQFQRNQSVYFERISLCATMEQHEFNIITFPVACLIVVICIVSTKRISLLRKACHGYGAPPIPVDFISHLNRKFAAIIFAIIADELLDVVASVIGNSTNSGDGVLVKFLLRILKVLIMGFRFYPLLACIYIDTGLTLTCASFYIWLDFAFTIIKQGACRPTYYPTYDDFLTNSTDVSMKFRYYGTGSALIAVQLGMDVPRYLCLAYLSVKLPVMLIRKVLLLRKSRQPDDPQTVVAWTRSEEILLRMADPKSVETRYVKNLLRSARQQPTSEALIARLIPQSIYQWRDDFRFSTRILCIYASIFLLLFFVTTQACVEFVPALHELQADLQPIINILVDSFYAIQSTTTDSRVDPVKVKFPLPNLVQAYLLAVAMTTTIITVQLLILLVNIRRNLLQAFRGDDSEIPRRHRSQYISYATGNFQFAGYFIGYLIWGFILIATFSTCFFLCLNSLITHGSVPLLEQILKFIIPSLLIVLFKQLLNRLLAQFVFLQHGGDVLALNNRRFLMIFIYFNFFLDAFLGFVSSILRFVKTILAGTFYMCRLDYSPMGRKLETFDSGFNAYCGFIHTECTHRHPVMLLFVSYLLNRLREDQQSLKQIDSQGNEKISLGPRKSSRYLRKWKLAVFLVRNPVIVFFRKAFLSRMDPDDVRALNDKDADQQSALSHRKRVYIRQIDAARSNSVSEPVAGQIIVLRF